MKNKYLTIILFTLFFTGIPNINSFGQSELTIRKFDFGTGKVAEGYTQVTGKNIYNKKIGYGFISETPVVGIKRRDKDALKCDYCISDKPFYFVVDLPEGNYEIKITFGDKKHETKTTVKAESRRLMLEEVNTAKGEFVTKTIMVNVRTPQINETEKIRLKSREVVYLNWDNKLTIEFNNQNPCINAVEIIKVNDITTIFLAGNSTVVDQEYEPWAAWGQMLPCFFGNEVVIANYAESGEAMKSFEAAKRLKKIMTLIKPGDYMFIQFGHNDQKTQSSSYVEAFAGYKEYLKKFAQMAREHGGNPVLISSMHRRKFDENGQIINTHGDYPEAMKQAAEEENIPFINLNLMSEKLYEALGEEGSKKAFVHYPANSFPGQTTALEDNSHHSTYGAYQLAKCVIEGIKTNNLDIAKYLLDKESNYDPAKPDPPEEWKLPVSPSFQDIKPDGY